MPVIHWLYLRVGAGLARPGRWLASCRHKTGGGRGRREGEEGRGRREEGRERREGEEGGGR